MKKTIRDCFRYNRGILVVFSSLISFFLFWVILVEAQVQGNQWSEPYRLSGEEGNYLHCSNQIVTDQYGYAHAFWFEDGLSDGRFIIQYSRFDGETWTSPIDVYATQQDSGVLDQLSIATSQNDMLYLVWTEGGSQRQRPVYFTSVPVYNALSAQNWQKSVRIPEVSDAYRIKLQIDSRNVFHLVYSKFFEPQPGIYYVRSDDWGETWSDPIWINPDILLGYSPESLEFELDNQGGLHVVWNTNSSEQDAQEGGLLKYAHSLDGGDTWSIPFTIAEDNNEPGNTLSFPGPLLAVQNQTVHVIWAGGDLTYRNQRISSDRGQTWDTSRRIFGSLNGQAWDGLTADGLDRMHFLGQIRYPQGIWHAYWDKNHWVGPELIYLIARNHTEPIGERFHAHCVHSAIRLGNQLITTFYDRSDERPPALYAMYRTLDDVPQEVVQVLPTLTPAPTPSVQLPLPTSTAETVLLSRPKATLDPEIAQSVPDNLAKPGSVFWLALIPTSLVIGGVIVFQLSKRH